MAGEDDEDWEDIPEGEEDWEDDDEPQGGILVRERSLL